MEAQDVLCTKGSPHTFEKRRADLLQLRFVLRRLPIIQSNHHDDTDPLHEYVQNNAEYYQRGVVRGWRIRCGQA